MGIDLPCSLNCFFLCFSALQGGEYEMKNPESEEDKWVYFINKCTSCLYVFLNNNNKKISINNL